VLGAPDHPLPTGLHLEQPGLTHPLQVGPDGVGVEIEGLGDLGGGQGRRRPGHFEVDGVPRVVAQGLEHRQPIHWSKYYRE
jgi:hypothetical protein